MKSWINCFAGFCMLINSLVSFSDSKPGNFISGNNVTISINIQQK